MPQTIYNTGWNPSTWIGFVTFLVSLFFFYRLIRSLNMLWKIYRYPKLEIIERNGRKVQFKEKGKVIRSVVIDGLLLSTVIIFFYFAFGTGQQVKRTPIEEDGMRKLTEEMQEEKSLKEIKQEAEAKKQEVLKRVDEDAQREREEAEEYIQKVLERAEERNNQ
jgi:rRNA pseudouridine-1189 N-methylase Emg1 (Nep1/Mra1 family)